MSSPFKALSCGVLALFAAFGAAEIVYTVSVSPSSDKMQVSVRVPVEDGKDVTFQMPRWAPGSYRYRDNAAQMSDILARCGHGSDLTFTKPDPNTFTIKAEEHESVVLNYSLPISNESGAVHWSGPSSYVYVVDRKDEDVRLVVEAPEDWRVAVGLNPTDSTERVFTARDYDVLADNPVTVGDYYVDRYTVRSKPHFIVIRGAHKDDVDRARLLKVCKEITEYQADFFGGLPYDRYVWHFVTSDSANGGWGLEHLTSTQIGLATGLGYRTVGVISHEFFHLWNVKRIRSKPLGPFNYQELPQTGALWFLEGGTDYYAHLLLRRSEVGTPADFYDTLARNVQRTRANEKRFEISPYESSWRVRDASNGRGNSAGYEVNYYNTGFLASLCLDLELRSRTDNKHSLDDVVLALYELNKDNKPGFEEDEIRNLLVKLGGLEMGHFYDDLVRKPGELPLEEQLAKVGLKLYEKESVVADLGFEYRPNRESGGLVVREPKGAAEGKLKTGDVIVTVDGKMPQGMTNRWLQVLAEETLGRAKPGVELRLTVKREGSAEPLEVLLIPGEKTEKAWVVEEMPEAPKEAVRFRQVWLKR